MLFYQLAALNREYIPYRGRIEVVTNLFFLANNATLIVGKSQAFGAAILSIPCKPEFLARNCIPNLGAPVTFLFRRALLSIVIPIDFEKQIPTVTREIFKIVTLAKFSQEHSRLHVPQLMPPVIWTCEYAFPIRREVGRRVTRRILQHMQTLPRTRIPDPSGLVISDCAEQTSVWRPHCISYRLRVCQSAEHRRVGQSQYWAAFPGAHH